MVMETKLAYCILWALISFPVSYYSCKYISKLISKMHLDGLELELKDIRDIKSGLMETFDVKGDSDNSNEQIVEAVSTVLYEGTNESNFDENGSIVYARLVLLHLKKVAGDIEFKALDYDSSGNLSRLLDGFDDKLDFLEERYGEFLTGDVKNSVEESIDIIHRLILNELSLMLADKDFSAKELESEIKEIASIHVGIVFAER